MRKLIIRLRKENKSYGEIAKIVNMSRSSIQTVVKNYNKYQTTENRHRSGRPSKLTDRDKRDVIRIVTANPKTSAVDIAKYLEKLNEVSVHPETVRNVLRANDFHSRIPRKKPFISKVNMAKRLDFAKLHQNDDFDYWKNVIFSDESKFNMDTMVSKGYGGNQIQ